MVDDDARDDAAERLLTTMDGTRTTVSRLPTLIAAHAGLPPSRLAALGRIAAGGAGITDVADATLLSVSAASRTVDALVDEGLVDRARDPDNRRSVVLSLTAEGAALAEDLREHFRQAYVEPVVDRLGPARVREVAAALDDLVAALADTLDVGS